MKKVISLVMVVCMILGMGLYVSARYPVGLLPEGKTIKPWLTYDEDFFADGILYEKNVELPSDGTNFALWKQTQENGTVTSGAEWGKGYYVDVTGASWATITYDLSVVGAKTDWTGATALVFWVDASEVSSDVMFGVHLARMNETRSGRAKSWNTLGARTLPLEKSTDGLAWTSATLTTPSNGYYLEGGYKGWVKVPLTNGSLFNGNLTPADLALVDALMIYVHDRKTTNPEGNTGRIIFDSIGFVTEPSAEVPATVYKGVQRSDIIDNTYNIRLVATVDSLDYEAVGFDVSADYTEGGLAAAKDLSKSCSYVYDKLIGKTEVGIVEYEAGDLGGNFLMALTIIGIPADIGEVTFTVKPYVVVDGIKNYGQTYMVVYNNGVLINQYIG